LLQNFPNPFNPKTAISYRLLANSFVRLAVYDVLGREITNLVDGIRPPGTHTAYWNAGSLPSGIYVCRLSVTDAGEGRTQQQVQTIKMLLLK